MKFDITKTPKNDIILDIPWLKQWNSQIDQTNEQIFFIRDPKFSKLQTVPQLDNHMNCNIQILSATEMKTLAKKDNTYIFQTKKISATLSIKISEKYKNFQGLFKLEKDKNFLSPHQPQNHKIKLEKDKKPGKHAIYSLSDFKLKILKKYFNENLKRSLI